MATVQSKCKSIDWRTSSYETNTTGWKRYEGRGDMDRSFYYIFDTLSCQNLDPQVLKESWRGPTMKKENEEISMQHVVLSRSLD